MLLQHKNVNAVYKKSYLLLNVFAFSAHLLSKWCRMFPDIIPSQFYFCKLYLKNIFFLGKVQCVKPKQSHHFFLRSNRYHIFTLRYRKPGIILYQNIPYDALNTRRRLLYERFWDKSQKSFRRFLAVFLPKQSMLPK